jgi:hypothetical protein
MSSSTRREFLKVAATAASLAASQTNGLRQVIQAAEATQSSGKAFQVACYYFPNYHPTDARNEKYKGKGWCEWELVKATKPSFPGHRQPKVPLWGYTDESDPKDMAQKIDAAADHGIDAFIFDWYYYNDGLFLERGIEKGFFGAKNNHRLKFSLMWANHDWCDVHPYVPKQGLKLVYPGRISPATFDKMTDYIVATYFKHPSYWLIDGCPYFSIYDLTKLIENFGSVADTRKALDRFRAKVKTAGFADLNLNAVVWENVKVPGSSKPVAPIEIIKPLGFNSATSYTWLHYAGLPERETPYEKVRDPYMKFWDKMERECPVPYYPNVTMGWDTNPRFANTNTIGGNTPEAFRKALELTKERLARRAGTKVLNIEAWNEWTEGSYLEPDTITGMQYLDAVRAVFGT